MSLSTEPETSPTAVEPNRHDDPSAHEKAQHRRLSRWGGIAGLTGAGLLAGSMAVVVSLGLPDASDPETLTDFANIKSGRIAEHVLYLGALVLFALHVLVLHQLLARAHRPAALFGAALAEFGLVMMAASSMLHVATAPLADLYTSPGASPSDLRAIEYAWHGAQSVFDTMLATGALLVPVGFVLLGLAMLRTPLFSRGISMLALGLGVVGIVGATIGIVDPGSIFLAASVLAIGVFHFSVGWATLTTAKTSAGLAGSAPVLGD